MLFFNAFGIAADDDAFCLSSTVFTHLNNVYHFEYNLQMADKEKKLLT